MQRKAAQFAAMKSPQLCHTMVAAQGSVTRGVIAFDRSERKLLGHGYSVG